uniref:Uncharacterized protein n=1 Tax=Triticum urartu TaxID=4572 RepID=A0A8R7TXV2_TRIUA
MLEPRASWTCGNYNLFSILCSSPADHLRGRRAPAGRGDAGLRWVSWWRQSNDR